MSVNDPEVLLQVLMAQYELFPEHTGLTSEQLEQVKLHVRRGADAARNDKRYLKGLQEAVRDSIKSILDHLEPKDVARFDQEVRDRTGFSIFKFMKSVEKNIREILKRGEVQNEFEYRLLMEVLEENWESGRIDEVVKLMKEYEMD